MSATTAAGQPSPAGATGEGGGFAESFRGIVAVVVAVLLLLGFAALVVFLVAQAGTASEGTWSRFVFLFGAAEALVFTAVGWLFGREVNRQAAQNAESRANESSARAESATAEAAQQEAKGKALRAAVEVRAAGAGAGGGLLEEKGIGGPGAGDTSTRAARELADLARQLFPDR